MPGRSTRPGEKTRGTRASEVVARLRRLYPEATCELEHVDPFQLLVATILSAQTTDKAVNQVTPALFAAYPDAVALARAEPPAVEPLIATIGLFRNKARAIVGTARALVERHGGAVPRERLALEALPGVGRKTANVVLSTAFGEPALAVDTHVARLAGRLGLSRSDDPRAIEDDLTSVLDPRDWGFTSHALIWHGRRVCAARAPRCADCGLADVCPSRRA
jgi:endonuclease-3